MVTLNDPFFVNCRQLHDGGVRPPVGGEPRYAITGLAGWKRFICEHDGARRLFYYHERSNVSSMTAVLNNVILFVCLFVSYQCFQWQNPMLLHDSLYRVNFSLNNLSTHPMPHDEKVLFVRVPTKRMYNNVLKNTVSPNLFYPGTEPDKLRKLKSSSS